MREIIPADRYYEKRLERVHRQKDLYDKRAEIREIKKQMRPAKPTTTKIIIA